MKKFRLVPEAWDNMPTIVLENIYGEFKTWYFRNEEGMTERQADKEWKRGEELLRYIEERKEIEK